MGGNEMSKSRFGVTVLIICLILATIPATVCAAPHPINQHKIITESDNGKFIILKKGDTVYLKLKENPSTGYSWNLTMSKGLKLKSDEYISSNPSNKLIVGAGGVHLWEIKATARGKQQIEGIYKRSWEQETGAEQKFKLNIIVI